MSRVLRIVFLVVAALGFCLTAQQLHHVNHMAASRGLDSRAPPPPQQPRAAPGFVEVEHPTSVQDAPPAAQAAQTSTADDDGLGHRDTNDGGGAADDSQPRPTRVKTPAAETVLPVNTKVPVAMSAAATSPSDPGFLALVASLGLMTLGMTLV